MFLFGCSNKDISVKEDVSAKLEQESAVFSCPHNVRKGIFFTSNAKKDILDIQIIGHDCDTARIVIKIITSDDKRVHQTEARALDYTYEDVGAEGVRDMLETLISSEWHMGELKKHTYILTEKAGYYEVNSAAVAHLKYNQVPLFCHRAGKNFDNCYVFLNGESVFAFSFGS